MSDISGREGKHTTWNDRHMYMYMYEYLPNVPSDDHIQYPDLAPHPTGPTGSQLRSSQREYPKAVNVDPSHHTRESAQGCE